ncbi:DUF6418 domain-containing protein, partial [Bacillus sp. JJ1122]|uniref:DUF6418 domain-containing protein n=1 Tax=Bacillus sp. JJ1122 TaxID=3122951 RepID=UPI002FFD7F07
DLLIQNKSIDLTKFFINLSLIVVALFISLILIETVSVRIKFGEVNRFSFNSYMNLMKNPLFVIFDSGYPIVVTFLFIILYEMKKFSYRLISSMLILMLIIKFLLQGHKFTPFYSSLLYLSIIYFILYFKNDKMKILTALKNKKIIIILTATVLLLSFRVVNNYKKEFNYTTDQAVEFAIYRALGLQGHVWWGVDYNEKVAPLNKNERIVFVIKEFDSTENIKGLKRLMYYIAPKELVDHYLTYGVSFTMGFPAILIFLFGQYMSIPILMFIGICLGIYIYFLNYLLITKRYFVFISQMYIYFTLITYFLLMGNATTFFTITNLLIFVTSIFVYLISKLLTKVKFNYL